MIGYRITLSDLTRFIEAEVPGWLQRAKSRTDQFEVAGKYEEASSIWSEVKAVYMRLQGESKCIYCERKLEGEELGKSEQDVEHFRPKGRVRAWRLPRELSKQGVVLTIPMAGAPGYHLLPYHILNYSAACKPCNSALKSDHFPIAGTYDFSAVDPSVLNAKEKPLLIFPIGDFDSNPEDLLDFHGVSPRPRIRKGHEWHRALTTIEFFGLDDPIRRKNLIRERAMVISALYPQLEVLAGGSSAKKKIARTLVDGFTSDRSAHANCARSFRALHAHDPAEAECVFEQVAAFIDASS